MNDGRLLKDGRLPASKTVSATDLEDDEEEELLLLISGMGMTQQVEGGGTEYWVGEEVHECVSDLQRYVRRDDPGSMRTHRALGTWRTVQSHLLPMLRAKANDHKLVFEVLKLVVKLTMKPEQLGAKMLEQLREKKNPDSIIGKHMGELWAHHRAYKKEFTKEDTMGTLVRLMARPLAKAEGQRSEEETQTIELVLALLLNLLYTAPPDAKPPEHWQINEALQDTVRLRKLLVALHKEHGLDLLMYITQQVEDEHGSSRFWNLTLLEIFNSVLCAATPPRPNPNLNPNPNPSLQPSP